MAGGVGGGGDDNPIADINITPFVDIVLVILIIFMITAPMLYQSTIDVNLPKADSGQQSEKSTLTFTINKEGELKWDKEKVKWEDVPGKLKALGGSLSTKTAIITADTATSHGTVVKLMDILRKSGVTKVGITVEGQGR
ncbi:MAG TPA: biopolymer transporter ExbD [Leptospiraceae bacterium]|nr:biopolymer transporter ExbD [Leptospirales bacterium]HMU82350.1 biopolymer transporter ExbD [Leptospiraceae bacterium]HMW59494.1 biopolymer transporter ExbD [Leptospiraceae bacterium]HMX55682.1 biopolymer transporter ExbD [Leptospiraceae bacterium]HMY45650.1 biopolymer transporter ExbD [Leptospiraceae bacterium]